MSIGLPLLVAFLHLACLVCLLQGEDERLKTSKVSNQLEDPENPHNTHLDYDALAILISRNYQSDDLSRLSNDLEVLETLEQEGEVEGDDCKQVDHVHRILDELHLHRANDQPDEILHGEVDNYKVVNEPNDVKQKWKVQVAFFVGLELVSSGDDEGDGGEEDHGEGEYSQELGQIARPWILDCVPTPGPPLAQL